MCTCGIGNERKKFKIIKKILTESSSNGIIDISAGDITIIDITSMDITSHDISSYTVGT